MGDAPQWPIVASSELAATLSLPHDRHAPAMARAFLSEHCDGLPAAVVGDAALLVTELVTNAVLHGEPPISLTLTVTSVTIEASITDAGAGTPLLDTRPVSGSQLHGRGLQIVDAVAAAWGIETGRDGYGTRVWFRLATQDPKATRFTSGK